MEEIYPDFFYALRLAKAFADHDQFKELRHRFDGSTLDEDITCEMALMAVDLVFQDTSVYFNEEGMFEIWVLMDPVIDQFCRLCRRYEERNGVGEDGNPYMREIIQTIHCAFSLDAYHYDYDWRLSAGDRGRKRILFFTGQEFYGLYETPMALLEIWEGFRDLNRKLEAELGLNKLVPLYPPRTEAKEAA